MQSTNLLNPDHKPNSSLEILSNNIYLFFEAGFTQENFLAIFALIQTYKADLNKFIEIHFDGSNKVNVSDFFQRVISTLEYKYQTGGNREDPTEQVDLLINRGNPFLMQLDFVTLCLLALYIHSLSEKPDQLTGTISLNSLTYDFINIDSLETIQANQGLILLISEIVNNNLNLATLKLKLELVITILLSDINNPNLDKLKAARGEFMLLGINEVRKYIQLNELDLISLSENGILSIVNLVKDACEEMWLFNREGLAKVQNSEIELQQYMDSISKKADEIKEKLKAGVSQLIKDESNLAQFENDNYNQTVIAEAIYDFFNGKIFRPISDLATNNTTRQVGDLYGKVIHIMISSLVFIHWHKDL